MWAADIPQTWNCPWWSEEAAAMKEDIRLGKVSSVDPAAGMVRVVYHEKDNAVTRSIPILSPVFSGLYSLPEVGDQVLVLHLSNGSEAGVVMAPPAVMFKVPSQWIVRSWALAS